MRRAILASLALVCASAYAIAAPMVALDTAPMVVAHPDWSAGYEAAYVELCDVTSTERAAWASPIPVKGPRVSAGEYTSGFIAAMEDANFYEEEGYDRFEYCGDNQP